ncbi:MAG: HAD family hydrolase [Deltaproteobacteria bacterium]|nr:HAD family hydrolase [Deltaproteobacteria bacterium]
MRTLIFDLDGTLLDSKQSILTSIDFALNEIGHKGLSYDKRQAVQQDLATTLKKTGDLLGISFSEHQIASFIAIYRKHHSTSPEKTMVAYEGVQDGLLELKKNFTLAVATTKHTAQAELILQKLKLDHFFDHIQGTDSGMKYKPAPDILFHTLKMLGNSEANLSAYIGDSVHDMAAAKAAGMRSVGAAYGFSGSEELKAISPDHLIHEFKDLLSLFNNP